MAYIFSLWKTKISNLSQLGMYYESFHWVFCDIFNLLTQFIYFSHYVHSVISFLKESIRIAQFLAS